MEPCEQRFDQVSLFPELASGQDRVPRRHPKFASPRPSVAIDGPCGGYVAAWLEEYPATTASSYLCDLSNFLEHCEKEGMDALAAKRGDLARYLGALPSRGMAPASIARRASGLSSFYAYLVATGLITSSPAAGLRRPRHEGSSRLGLDLGELARILGAARMRDKGTWCLVALMAMAGLRVSEACGLCVGDLRHEAGRPVVVARRKGGTIATVAIPVLLAEELSRLAGQRHQDAPLLLGPSGGWMSRQAAGRIVRALGIAAGIERRVHPHLLRHSFVSVALGAGVSLGAVAEAAGHRDLTVTLTYATALRRATEAPADVVAAAIEGSAANVDKRAEEGIGAYSTK